jgi:hypothetical protein
VSVKDEDICRVIGELAHELDLDETTFAIYIF